MNTEKTVKLFGMLGLMAAAALPAFAQEDLDSLLSDLEKKPAKKAEAAKPAPAAAEQQAEAPKAEEKKAEEKPAEEAKPAVAEEKKAEPAAEEKKAEEKPAEEAKPVVAEEKKAEAPKADSDAALLSDLMTTETLRRESLDVQAQRELEDARKAMTTRDWDEAYRLYGLAMAHLNDRVASRPLKVECRQGMAEAQYQAGKQAMKEGDRETAHKYAEEALKLRHPRAAQLLEALTGEKEQDAEKDVTAIKHRRNDEDYKTDREQMRARLRRAAQYLTVSDLDNALDQVDLVLRKDPYNSEALSLRARIQRRRDVILQTERDATRRGMIADVSAAWRPVYAVNSPELKNVDGGTVQTKVGGDPERSVEQDIEKRMKQMILPTIAFRPPATIIDAVDYFRQASKDFDRPDIPVDQRGFNFVLDIGKALTGGAAGAAAGGKSDSNDFSASADDGDAAGGNGDVPQIPNISASNVSLWEALKLVCKISGFKFKVQGPVVMVMPKDMTTDELLTRSYTVTENFADRMSGASSDMKDMKAGSFGKDKGDEDEEASDQTAAWKKIFTEMGVDWPKGSQISYIKSLGKLRVKNTADQLAIFEQALNEMNVTPTMIEIETRFVEVAQEDLNSLGFEWLLNSDYSFNVGGKLGKVLGLKDGQFNTSSTSTESYTLAPVVTDNGTETTTTYAQIQNGKTTTTASSWVREGYQGVNAAGYPYTVGNTGKNVGVNAVDGSSYSTGMRYLSTEGNHISGEGASSNDKFMKVNAFLGNADLSMILHMLSQRSDTDLLSAPKVVTKSGAEAVIKVVTEYIYPQDYDVTIQSTSSSSSSSSSSSGSGGDGKILPMVEPQNFTMREVGVILDVTPEVSAEGQMINLELKPQIISEPTWKDYGMKVPMATVMSESAQVYNEMSGGDMWFNVPMEQPFFKVRSIDTHVSLYNGATLVMGGLITEERKSMEDKIPFLGDIPWIGRFFRSRSEWSDKRNLLLFVTARLVDPNGRQMTMGQGDDSAKADASKAAPAPVAK